MLKAVTGCGEREQRTGVLIKKSPMKFSCSVFVGIALT